MSKIKLKPCPFCEGAAKIEGARLYNVVCVVCFAEGPSRSTYEAACNDWNTRGIPTKYLI